MDKFTDADVATLLSQPGYFYYREYATSNPWVKAVFANGSAFAPTVEIAEIAFDDVGNVRDEVSNETAAVTLSSGRVLDPEFLNDITGGLYTKEVVAGTLVTGANQVVASGTYEYDGVVLFENQNGDLSQPSVTSITGATDGLLVAGTDYELVKLPEIGWGVYFVTGGAITTLLQDMTIVYDYTPNAKTILKRGGIKIITPIELAFQTTDENGDYVQIIFYKCFTDGADGHGFSPELTAEPITMDLTFTAKKDTNRTDGDQLYSKIFGGDNLG